MGQRLTPRLGRRAVLTGAAGALAAPYIARGAGKTIRIGLQSVFSGPLAQVGITSYRGAMLAAEEINRAGGIDGRSIEFVQRDSKSQPQEAARIARELFNTDGCELLLDAETSAGAFAVNQVIRDLGGFCIHSNSETSALTADPKLRVATAFRTARQGIHDAIVGGAFAAKVANEQNLTRWATCSPDYAYGRDTTAQYLEYLRHFKPNVELVAQVWPKLGAPDFTDSITKILQAHPQAFYTALYAGDLVSFINQGNIFSLFGQSRTFSVNLADYTTMAAIKSPPAGILAGNRCSETVPDTEQNRAWHAAYVKRWSDHPTNWSWENYTAIQFMAAAAKAAGTADGKKMAEALPGLAIGSPFGANGKITMRGDHTIVDYAIGWGATTPKPPYLTGVQLGDWGQIAELEAEWKKKMGYV